MTLENYFKSSTIHGFAYLSRSNHIVERIFWIILQAISIICTSILIFEFVLKIRSFPIVIQLSDKQIPISEINFPAITFCGGVFMENTPQGTFFPKYEVHSMKESSKTFEEFYGIPPEVAEFPIKMYEVPTKLEASGIDLKNISEFTLKRIQIVDLVTKSGIFQRLNMSIPTHDILKYLNTFHKQLIRLIESIYWRNHFAVDLSEIVTENGLCLTFNMANLTDVLDTNVVSHDFHFRHVHEVTSDRSYESSNRPLRTVRSDDGIVAYVPDIGNSDTNAFCELCAGMLKTSIKVAGIYVLIHDPYELPSINVKKYAANVNNRVKFFFNPELMKTDNRIKLLKLNKRNCYVDKEKKLRFFKKYTKLNCEMECLSDYMINRCGCVEFHMIRNSTTRICSACEKYCYDKAIYDFELEGTDHCKCLAPCDYVMYKVEIEEHPKYADDDGYLTQNINLHAKFAENLYSQYIRKQQFNEIDFLSFVGGLLGLFAGFSALSFVELIYWLIVRPIEDILRRRSTRVVPFQSRTSDSREKSNFIEFMQNSSVHGVTYFLEKNMIGKIFWISSFFLSIGLCGWLMSRVSEKVPNSRVISYDVNINAVKNIPFPAVTFVPELVIHTSYQVVYYSLDDLFEQMQNMTDDEIDLAQRGFVTDGFCSHSFVTVQNYSVAPLVPKYILRDFDWFSRQFSTFNRILSPKFAATRTIGGLGFTFNLLDADKLLNVDEVDEELLYAANISLAGADKLLEMSEFYPHPVTVTNFGYIEFNLKMTKNSDSQNGKERYEITYDCNTPKYAIGRIDDYPTFLEADDFENLNYGIKLEVRVTPIVIRTDESLLKLDAYERDCYKDDEMKLRFFKKYTQRNCEIECVTNYTIEICNCSLLTQPYNPSNGINICEYQYDYLMHCPDNVRKKLLSLNFSYKHNCSCLPTCDTVSYKYTYIREIIESNEMILQVIMNIDDMVLYRRYQQFTSSDVISYVGGLLGLFAGISMLSVVEFVYFFTFRLWINLWKRLMIN